MNISYSKQDINNEDIESVIKVLKSDFLTQGPVIELFENEINKYCNSKYSVAVNSATSALHIACLSIGLGQGDWLWTSPITFAASSNCGLLCGANVDFVDIDIDTYNIDIDLLTEKLKIAEKDNKLPKVVIPVHMGGKPCDMKKIYELSIIYGFKIIEDASHALGASYHKGKIGSCDYSDITVFSFHPVKMITTGEGGLATTNDHLIFEQMKLYRNHGITRNTEMMKNKLNEPWHYEQINLGLNYRLSDISSALGLNQLKRLDEFVNIRNNLALNYNEFFKNINISLPHSDKNIQSSFHLYIIRMDFDKMNLSKKDMFNYFYENSINLNVHYIPVHLHPYYKNLGFNKGDFPISEKYYLQAITLPLHTKITLKEQEKVYNTLIEFIDNK